MKLTISVNPNCIAKRIVTADASAGISKNVVITYNNTEASLSETRQLMFPRLAAGVHATLTMANPGELRPGREGGMQVQVDHERSHRSENYL